MPIQELRTVRRMRSAGRLRLGRRTERGLPQKVEHFIFDPVDPALASPFRYIYGETPTSVDVVLPEQVLVEAPPGGIDPEQSALATIDRVFPQWRRYWKGSGLYCQGDGQTAERATAQKGVKEQIACSDDCPFWAAEKPQCQYEGNLSFRLWKLPTLDPFQVRARRLSIIRLNSDIVRLFEEFGRVRGIPLRLFLTPYKTEYGVVQVINLAVEADPQRIEMFNKICPSDALPSPTAPALAAPAPLALPEAQAEPEPEAKPEPPEPPEPPTPEPFGTAPPETRAPSPQEKEQVQALLGAIDRSLHEEDVRCQEIRRVLSGQDPDRPHTVAVLTRIWDYLRAEWADDTMFEGEDPDEYLRTAGWPRAVTLAANPEEALAMHRLLLDIQEAVRPLPAGAERTSVLKVVLGCSTKTPRTMENLQRIITHYQQKNQNEPKGEGR